MKQILINALIELINKSGGEKNISQLITKTNEDNNPILWTEGEIDKAVSFIHNLNTNFGKESAMEIIKNLQGRYKLNEEDFQACLPEQKFAVNEEL